MNGPEFIWRIMLVKIKIKPKNYIFLILLKGTERVLLSTASNKLFLSHCVKLFYVYQSLLHVSTIIVKYKDFEQVKNNIKANVL
jgi:hypothetical protein